MVQETLNVVATKPAAPEAVRSFLESVLVPLWRVMPSQRLYERGLEIRSRYRYRFYDSLIIAAALEAGCTSLSSEDLQHGQRIETVTIENPFVA